MIDKFKAYHSIFIYLSILLVVFSVLSPIILHNIWMNSHEKVRYLYLLDEFKDAVHHGIIYPRWLPNACGGYGYPTFIFYQPGFFFIALLFSFLHGYPLSTMYATLIFLFFIGGIGVYKLCKELSGKFIGLFCSVFFLLTPYLYVNLYVRGDLSELMAMLLCAWPIYFLMRLKKCINTNSFHAGAMFGIVISLLAVTISHPATAMFFFIAFCFIFISMVLDMGFLKGKFALRVILSVIVSLALSSSYWFTLLQMKKYVDFSAAINGYFSTPLHLVYPFQFFSRAWGFGGSIYGPNDGMSFQLGLPHFILATIGMLHSKKSIIIEMAYGLYLSFILLMSIFSLPIWLNLGIFRYVQFPWRILSVTAILQIICISSIVNISVFQKYKWFKIIAISTFLLFSILWYLGEFKVGNSIDVYKELELHRQNKLKEFYIYSEVNEFLPKTASLNNLGRARQDYPIVMISSPGEIKEVKGNNDYRLHYEAVSVAPALVLINQFYFPGWRVIIDGKDISRQGLERNLSIDGRILLFLGAGKHDIKAFYGEPPGWRVRNAIIFIALSVFIVFCFYSESKHFKRPIS